MYRILSAPRIQRWLGFAKSAPDRALHPLRRRRALARLRGVAPRSILFVCTGNLCRSPYAEFALRTLLGEGSGVACASAGLVSMRRSPPKKGLEVALRRGVDMSGHLSTLVDPASVGTAGIVVAMEPWHVAALHQRGCRAPVLLLGDFDPHPIRERLVPDPWRRPESAFEASYDRIDRCLREMARVLAAGPVGAHRP